MMDFSQVYRWYRGILPVYGSADYVQFLRSTGRFAGYVLQRYPRRGKITVDMADIATAISNIPGNEIKLPYWALTPRLWQQVHPHIPVIPPRDYSAASIAALTGLLLHEAGHFEWSPPTPEDAINRNRHPNLRAYVKENKEGVFTMFQYVEDLFIENQLRKRYYGLFVDVLDDLLFTAERFDAELVEFQNNPTVESLVNLTLCFKNPDLRHPDLWVSLPEQFVELSTKALDEHTQNERVNIAIALYELFREIFKNEAGDEDRNYCNSSGGQWDEDAKSSGQHMPNGDMVENERSLAGQVNREVGAAFEHGHSDLQGLKEEIEKTIRKPYPDPVEFSEGAPEPVEEEITTATHLNSGYERRVEPNSEFRPFGRILRSLRSVNTTPGLPSKRGHRIVPTRVYRIATDEKVFGPPKQRDARKQAEVIISINASGSMRYLMQRVLSAAYGTMESLKENQVRCTVYAHTTVPGNRETPYLVKIADTAQTVDVAHRFYLASSIDQRESYDGQILKRLSERFSKKLCTKVLIEMTDGAPNAGYNYTGKPARQHVNKVVNYLRGQGIVVLALSLDENVMDANNEIYGEKYNISASDNIEAALRRAVQEALL